MRRAFFVLLAALIASLLVLPAAGMVMQVNASPVKARIGDVVTLSGSIHGVKTIAIYLFVTGPDLNPRGVTLENLNIPAGRGLFTTAPVDIADGTWKYRWDTSVILGTLQPGTYTVYAVSTPLDRLRYAPGEYAMTEIEFLPSESGEKEMPLHVLLPVAALGICIAAAGILRRTGRR